MDAPGFLAFELRGDLVQLEPSVDRHVAHAPQQRARARTVIGLKPRATARFCSSTRQRVDAADDGRHRQAHRVAERLLGETTFALTGRPSPPRLFIPIGAMPAPVELGQHVLLEAAEGGVEAVERQLTRVPREVVREHRQVQRRDPCGR